MNLQQKTESNVEQMRFLQFLKDGLHRVGKVNKNGLILDVTRHLPAITTMKCLLETFDQSMKTISSADREENYNISSDDVEILAPVTNPEKIVCIGMNYTDHCEELGAPIPKEPLVFSKYSNAIISPTGNILHPRNTQKLDYEVELAFVIGKEGKYIKEEDALDHVFGFTVAHDVSARDNQFKDGGQWLLGKTFDTSLPLGPVLVSKDDISDPHKLGIRCRVNGEIVQNSNTQNMVFKTPQIVSYVSQYMRLKPGDIFITGTPPGVGCFKKPPVFLKAGDVVECEIDEIGLIKNEVVAE